jgi:hypothetical protein
MAGRAATLKTATATEAGFFLRQRRLGRHAFRAHATVAWIS